MNVFDDLINELKDEDLIEETVIEGSEIISDEYIVERNGKMDENDSFNESEIIGGEILTNNSEVAIVEEARIINKNVENEDEVFEEEVNIKADPQAKIDKKTESGKKTAVEKNKDYFQKRAMEEVSFLQMVEHVMSGAEREQLKTVPKPYDDLVVKKVLHEYITIAKENDLANQAKAEFKLLQETESWYTALSHRDKHISVGQLRRFCETTKPALSSPALVSLSRFYRNSPFSEQIRNKFDLIITRVFTTDIDEDKRELVFTREELIDHITGLYAEWESIPMYSTEEDDAEILQIATKFEEFMAEAEASESFDDLVKRDFFNRLRGFKIALNENFFAPGVIAAAIECNIKIGNRYVDLIAKERNNASPESLEEKYGLLHDQVISDVTSKTLQLVDLLNEKSTHAKAKSKGQTEAEKRRSLGKKGWLSKDKRESSNFQKHFKLNKWILIAGILTIILTFGLYLWDGSNSAPIQNATPVQKLTFEDPQLNENFISPRISNDTLYAVVTENWNILSEIEKQNLVKTAMALGSKEKFTKIHIFNKQGKTVGGAAGEKIFIQKEE